MAASTVSVSLSVGSLCSFIDTAPHRQSHEQNHEHDRKRDHDHDDAGVNREQDKKGA
jgi:hypothetical protein